MHHEAGDQQLLGVGRSLGQGDQDAAWFLPYAARSTGDAAKPAVVAPLHIPQQGRGNCIGVQEHPSCEAGVGHDATWQVHACEAHPILGCSGHEHWHATLAALAEPHQL